MAEKVEADSSLSHVLIDPGRSGATVTPSASTTAGMLASAAVPIVATTQPGASAPTSAASAAAAATAAAAAAAAVAAAQQNSTTQPNALASHGAVPQPVTAQSHAAVEHSEPGHQSGNTIQHPELQQPVATSESDGAGPGHVGVHLPTAPAAVPGLTPMMPEAPAATPGSVHVLQADLELVEVKEAMRVAVDVFNRVKSEKMTSETSPLSADSVGYQGVPREIVDKAIKQKERERANRASAAASRNKVMRYQSELEARLNRVEAERNAYRRQCSVLKSEMGAVNSSIRSELALAHSWISKLQQQHPDTVSRERQSYVLRSQCLLLSWRHAQYRE